ncbi:MAG: hypothetical protein MK052_06615 [Alphaproteobacteria bacterium]|nr:hypothetical protein [Alphaproteobacteria bacterium]
MAKRPDMGNPLDGIGKGDSDGKPVAAAAADAMSDKFSQLRDSSIKEKTVMAGGAALAADGVRRAVTKDCEGKRHVVRGTVQAVVGTASFAAAVATSRKSSNVER